MCLVWEIILKNKKTIEREKNKTTSPISSLAQFIVNTPNELKFKQEKFRTIFDKSSDAYFILDSKFRINVYNEKVNTFFGKLREVNFLDWVERNSPIEQPKGMNSLSLFKDMKSSVDKQGELRFEWEFMSIDGEEFPTEISMIMLPLSNNYLYFMIIRNVFNQKRIEFELRKNLEREKELNEMRSKFISMASHEFKTPLATILTNLDLLELKLQKQGASLQDLQIDKYISRMENESHRLNILMDEVLQLGKIEAGKTPFYPEYVDVELFLTSYLQEYNDRTSNDREVKLNFDLSTSHFWLDMDLISHVFDNLISNALKYSSKDVIININVRRESFLFEIIDKGIGIPLNEFSHLFESFFRASNTDHIQGTGLGLVIAKEFVEIHGGVIVCESEENIGSTFRVAIPAK
ncbi:PAS domain-containing sensor histidine kinase [Flammeovirga pacifica]|uniref:histidine kinase n=1 Tax=Flammeovirga pacifica TaxID=915059 RepID=A0A1S1YY32_FLAPC|nr:PAS domain-containing sensor histidine kinase [Flammeovirga pacifica]OHX65916.1 hypothetical protein NH26_05885 [Flammeovirga pacifica]